ncbi:hypothetical protein CEQ30_24610 [Nocardia brasiliensis]|nr:hypothetical protein CEQ30_24610 [Nocardia brasiliensis]
MRGIACHALPHRGQRRELNLLLVQFGADLTVHLADRGGDLAERIQIHLSLSVEQRAERRIIGQIRAPVPELVVDGVVARQIALEVHQTFGAVIQHLLDRRAVAGLVINH